MFTAAFITSLVLITLALVQVFQTWGFIQRLRAPRCTSLSDAKCAKAAVIICVRDIDPTLRECINAALEQDYPDYAVHIVVDSQSDPAWPLVNQVVAVNQQTPSSIQTLKNPFPTCSLKCSSIIQAISELDASYEIVALLDTDVIPGRNWLRDLVTPLEHSSVGATTGNRWFSPDPSSWASLARYAWNAAAVVLMYRLKIAWGGSLAIKRTVIEQGQLLSVWSRTYCEDTAINPALRQLGLRLEFTPSAIMIQQQHCDFHQLLDWIIRQLIACRLHHHGWRVVVAQGIATSVAMASGVLLTLVAISMLDWDVLALMAGAFIAYLLILLILLVGVEHIGRESLNSIDETANCFMCSVLYGRLLIAIIFAHYFHGLGLMKAANARAVTWRGVRYEILQGHRLRIIEISPSTTESTSSFLKSVRTFEWR